MVTISIGSRKSKLAMWQTDMVASVLEGNGMETIINSMETKGDKILNKTIAKIGSKGVFTEELEDQLANGSTDIAVHSAKDMQSSLPEGFELIAFTAREKANDVLVSRNKALNPDDPDANITIGTSSVRRVALLKHYYPHIKTVEMRGNLQTRIQKMDDGACDALMLAYAGVKRMEYEDMIIKVFPENEFIPPVGQGCIGIESATSLSVEKRKLVRDSLNDVSSEKCLLAERAFLRKLEGGCSIPAFGYATLEGNILTLTCGLSSLDGSKIIHETETGTADKAEQIGTIVGQRVLDSGGKEMLAEIKAIQSL